MRRGDSVGEVGDDKWDDAEESVGGEERVRAGNKCRTAHPNCRVLQVLYNRNIAVTPNKAERPFTDPPASRLHPISLRQVLLPAQITYQAQS